MENPISTKNKISPHMEYALPIKSGKAEEQPQSKNADDGMLRSVGGVKIGLFDVL
jgi:hypothetical protein